MAFPLPAPEISDKSGIGREKHVSVPAESSQFLPVHKSDVPAGPKCDVLREGRDKKRHKLKQKFVCESVTFFPEM